MAELFKEGFDWASDAVSYGYRWSTFAIVGNVTTDTQFGTGRAANQCVGTRTFSSNISEIYGSVRFKDPSTNSHFVPVTFYDGSTAQITIYQNAADGFFHVRRGTTGGTLLGSFFASPVAVWNSFQFRLVFHATAGIVQVRQNGGTTNLLDLSGQDTNMTANNYCNAFGITYNNNGGMVDDIWLNDTSGAQNNGWPGDMRIVVQTPNGAGASTQLTPSAGSNWQCVDEAPHTSDTDYVSSATVGHKDLYTVTALPVTPTIIRSATPFIVARKADAGARTVGVRHKSGATEATVASSATLGGGYGFLGATMETDPNTGAAWTKAAVEAQQVGPVIVA